MQQLQKAFDGHDVRVIAQNGEARIVAADLAKALGYTRANSMYTLVDGEWKGTAIVSTPGGRQEMTVLHEQGVYMVLGKSTKDATVPFQKWLYGEVIPDIRQTGSYTTTDTASDGDIKGILNKIVDEAETTAQKMKSLLSAADTMRTTASKVRSALRHDGSEPSDVEITESQKMYQLSQSVEGERDCEKRSKHLVLERPLVVFDLETTGLDPDNDMITQIAMYRRSPGPNGYPTADGALVTYVNPGLAIPEKITRITGITDEDVRSAPTFKELMPRISELLHDADLMGYNAASFDAPFLRAMYERHGDEMPSPSQRTVVDPLLLERAMRSNKLADTYRRYTGHPLKNAHDADADIRATVEVLSAQIQALPVSGAPTPHEVAACARGRFLDDSQWLRKDGVDVLVCRGKHQGRTLKDVAAQEPGYVDWMRDNLGITEHIDAHIHA